MTSLAVIVWGVFRGRGNRPWLHGHTNSAIRLWDKIGKHGLAAPIENISRGPALIAVGSWRTLPLSGIPLCSKSNQNLYVIKYFSKLNYQHLNFTLTIPLASRYVPAVPCDFGHRKLYVLYTATVAPYYSIKPRFFVLLLPRFDWFVYCSL